MDKNVVVNEENESLKNQVKGWGIFLVVLAICGLLGMGNYSMPIAFFVTIFAFGVEIYLNRKNRKVEIV
jgi:uncharacterized membrane protein YjjP (DUF1212 family)